MYNKLIPNLLLIILICSCSIIPKKRCWKTGFIKNDSTWFPKPQLDFVPLQYQARLGLSKDNDLRVWLKGSDEVNYAQAFSAEGKALTPIITLNDPYFTKAISIPNVHSANIKFGKTINSINTDTFNISVSSRSISSLNNEEHFSFLVYGCVQPFSVNDEGHPLLLHDKQNPLNLQMRKLFEAVGLEKPLQYLKNETFVNKALITNPVLAIGTGDQIYVDGGYEQSDFRNHALSAWAHGCKDPYPLLDHRGYEKHLNRCYQNYYSFQAFNKVFNQLPLISVWDDHEIRDGWGSHGDEYNKKTGEINKDLKPYFSMAKEAYVYHQLLPGNDFGDIKSMVENNIPLHQTYKIKGIPIFAFDLRSNRNIHSNQVINQEQMDAFKQWCSSLNDSSEVLIISSIPFFYKPFVSLKLLGRIFSPGLRDDINDGWYSKYNENQRNEIIQQLINLRNRNVKPIILSGDAHLGGLISAWYKDDKGVQKRLCYELIYSGLTHEVMGEERNGVIARLRKRSAGEIKDDPTFTVGDYDVHYIYEYTQARLNFGALEFKPGEATSASLFIVGDEEEYIEKRILNFNWIQTYEEYNQKAQNEAGTYTPPQLDVVKIFRDSL